MESPTYIHRALPFLSLGQDLAANHEKQNPDPFECKAVAEPTANLPLSIQTKTKAIQRAIAKDEALSGLREIIGIGINKAPPAIFIHALALNIFFDLATSRSGLSWDMLVQYMGSVMATGSEDSKDSKDILKDRLLARHALAHYLECNLFEMDNDHIHPCGRIAEWLTDGDRLLYCNVNEEVISRINARKRTEKKRVPVVEYVKNLPILTPEQMDRALVDLGYTGQEQARHVLCLSAYRHIQRLRRLHLDKVDPKELPRRENILCMGASGSGKTHLVNLLFENILKLPSVIVDITKFSETGYVGENMEEILTRLLLKADKDLGIAQTGIVCIDEIDKIAASATSGMRFGGARSSKDVSGIGVQRGLLKLLEPSLVDVPTSIGDHFRSDRVQFNTATTLFVGCGAFSGLDEIAKRVSRIGFDSAGGANIQGNVHLAHIAGQIAAYGLMPEFVGRFEQITCFNRLTRNELRHILEVNTIRTYRKELSLEGIDLVIEPSAIEHLVDEALERGTGARGLPAGLIGILTEAMYRVYSATGTNRRIAVYADGGNIQWDIDSAPFFKGTRVVKQAETAPDLPLSCTIPAH